MADELKDLSKIAKPMPPAYNQLVAEQAEAVAEELGLMEAWAALQQRLADGRGPYPQSDDSESYVELASVIAPQILTAVGDLCSDLASKGQLDVLVGNSTLLYEWGLRESEVAALNRYVAAVAG